MEEQLQERLRRWITPKTAVILGLSGGGDSVYLFHQLMDLKMLMDFPFLAVHVHHGLRGAEADEDEHFCRALCAHDGAQASFWRVDVQKRARAKGQTLEQAGREARYEVFYREARRLLTKRPELEGVSIFLAHHANDQEETVLMNLMRGSGPAGLSGMEQCTTVFCQEGRPVRLVRPLLLMPHKKLLQFLRERGFSWQEDATNQEADCTRNKLRLEILPRIREISPEFTSVCSREAALFSEIQDYLEQEARQFLSSHSASRDGCIEVPVEALGALHPALRHVVVRRCLEVIGGLTNIGMVHVEAVEELLDKQSGKYICLPRGGIVRRSFDVLSFESEDYVMKEEPKLSFSWQVEDFSGPEFLKNLKKISTACYTKWFDYDKIKTSCGSGEPVLRAPREGDYLFVNRQGQKKALSLYLKQEKIPQEKRQTLPVVAWGDMILWVPGHRDSAYFFVTEETTQILRLDIGQQEEGE